MTQDESPLKSIFNYASIVYVYILSICCESSSSICTCLVFNIVPVEAQVYRYGGHLTSVSLLDGLSEVWAWIERRL